jgi:hypothetical protein
VAVPAACNDIREAGRDERRPATRCGGGIAHRRAPREDGASRSVKLNGASVVGLDVRVHRSLRRNSFQSPEFKDSISVIYKGIPRLACCSNDDG